MNAVSVKDPCASDCACLVMPAEFVRLRYFFGQRLGVVDLADEQSYLVGKQRFHNRLGHGVGVLCGLTAERYVFPQGAPPTSDMTLLRVNRGAALDACGREIVVGWDQCIDVAAWFAQRQAMRAWAAGDVATPANGTSGPTAALTSLKLWIALCYRDCPSDPAPAPRDPCGCDAGGCEFARIREGFELKLLTDREEKLLVKREKGSRGGDFVPEEVLGESIDKAIARRIAGLAGTHCPEPPDDPCLVLASFTATLDSTGKKVVNISKPDNLIPERLSLLPASALQQGLMDVLAAASNAELVGSGPSYGALEFKGASATGGTLTIAVDGDLWPDSPLGTGSALLTANLYELIESGGSGTIGTWSKSSFSATYDKPSSGNPGSIALACAGLSEGRYRISIENDFAQPAVDKKMRPLPPRWARHLRLVKDQSSGNLTLADSLGL
jgi:hypothetical protein